MYKSHLVKIKNIDEKFFDDLFYESKLFYNLMIEINPKSFVENINFVNKIKNNKKYKVRLRVLTELMKLTLYKKYKNEKFSLDKRKMKNKNVGEIRFKNNLRTIDLSKNSYKLKGNKIIFNDLNKQFRLYGIERINKKEIYSISITRNAFGIYLLITTFKKDIKKHANIKLGKTGVDFGIKDTLTFSNGIKINFNHDIQLDKIKKAKRVLSKKQKGSNNYKKQLIKIKKLYEKHVRIKNDSAHKICAKLKKFKIAMQDEQIALWDLKYGKVVNNSILGRVKSALKLNPDTIVIDKFKPSTKQCFICEKHNKIELSNRMYSCSCGYKQDRDIHAAMNILRLAGLGQASEDMNNKLSKALLSLDGKYLSVRQETVIGSPHRLGRTI